MFFSKAFFGQYYQSSSWYRHLCCWSPRYSCAGTIEHEIGFGGVRECPKGAILSVVTLCHTLKLFKLEATVLRVSM